MEPIDIKEEPLDHDSYHHLLEPQIEMTENKQTSLSCPKCHIRYYSAMSIKNHIQVCKIKAADADSKCSIPFKSKPRLVIKGIKKLTEDERRSIRILEKSCFVNELQKQEESMQFSSNHFCQECDAAFDTPIKYARHLYAHTFIKQEDEDMPCICVSCGQDFLDKHQLNKHLKPEMECSGLSKFLYPCYFCQKIFTRKDNLRDDLRCHINADRRLNGKQKRDYKCNKCSKEYGGQTILNIHLLSHKKVNKRSALSAAGNKASSKKIKTEDPLMLITVKAEPLEIKSEPE